MDSYIESGGVTYSGTTAQGGTITYSSKEMAIRIRDMGLQGALGSYVDQRSNWSQEARGAYERAERLARNEFAGIGTSEEKENLIKARALQNAATQTNDMQAKRAWANFAGQVAGAEISGVAPVSVMTGQTYADKSKEWSGKAEKGAEVKEPSKLASQQTSNNGKAAQGAAVKVVVDAAEARRQMELDQERRLAAHRNTQEVLNSAPPGIDVKARPKKE